MGRRSKKRGVFAAIAAPVMRKAEPPNSSAEQALSQDPLIPHFVKHMDGTTARSFLAAMQGMRRQRYEDGAGYVRHGQPEDGDDSQYSATRHTFINRDYDPQNFFHSAPDPPPAAFDWDTRELIKPVGTQSKVTTMMGEPVRWKQEHTYRPPTFSSERVRLPIIPERVRKRYGKLQPGNVMRHFTRNDVDDSLSDSVKKERQRWKDEIPGTDEFQSDDEN